MPCFSASLLSHRSGRGAADLVTPADDGSGAMPSAYRRGGHAPSTESTGYRACLTVGVVATDGLMLFLHGADPAGQGVETDKAFGMALVIHFVGAEGGEVFGVEAVR